MSLSEWFLFMKQGLKSPLQIGTLWPTGAKLASAIVQNLDIQASDFVLEIGAGTGSITRELAKKINPRHALFVEIDPLFCQYLTKEFPDLTICNTSVVDLEPLMKKYQIKQFDFIICSIPWTHVTNDVQEHYLKMIANNLCEGGTFVTIVCVQSLFMKQAQQFKNKLSNHFSKIQRMPIVWQNIPPAIYYHCVK